MQQQKYNNDFEEAIIQLDHACNKIKRDKETIREWTIKAAEILAERIYKEGGGEHELSKICSIVCKRLPHHERQIQRVFDWTDPVTGEQPFRKYKGRYPVRDSKNPTYVGIEEPREAKVQTDNIIEGLNHLKKLEISEIGVNNFTTIVEQMHETLHSINKQAQHNDIQVFDPNKKTEEWSGVETTKRSRITLQPASVPESQRIRSQQEIIGRLFEIWAKEHEGLAKDCRVIKKDTVERNYISDNPEHGEKIISGLLAEIRDTLALLVAYSHDYTDSNTKEKMIKTYLETRTLTHDLILKNYILPMARLRKQS